MKAKIVVQVERETALEAIRALDALRDELDQHEFPKALKRRYKDARKDLVSALGWWAQSHGLSALPD